MKENQRYIRYENGKVYFTRATERRVFFFLTLIMLVAGVMFKTGLL